MDKYIYDNSNGLWYELQGDYYIPCLVLPAEKERLSGSLFRGIKVGSGNTRVAITHATLRLDNLGIFHYNQH